MPDLLGRLAVKNMFWSLSEYYWHHLQAAAEAAIRPAARPVHPAQLEIWKSEISADVVYPSTPKFTTNFTNRLYIFFSAKISVHFFPWKSENLKFPPTSYIHPRRKILRVDFTIGLSAKLSVQFFRRRWKSEISVTSYIHSRQNSRLILRRDFTIGLSAKLSVQFFQPTPNPKFL